MRVAELDDRLNRLRRRELQLDDLGDTHNEPAAMFQILAEEVSNLRGFDPEVLHRARLSRRESFSAAAQAFLDELGWQRLSSETSVALRMGLKDLGEREQFQSWGLFVDRSTNEGIALGISLIKQDAGKRIVSDADQEMQEQVVLACEAAGLEGWTTKLEWPAGFGGESIGLPMYVAALISQRKVPGHALTGSTGRLELGGRVTGVFAIAAKIDAARRIGIRRVIVPEENLQEAQCAAGPDLAVIAVTNTRDVLAALRQPLSSIELGYSELISLVRASIPDYRLVLEDEKDEAQGHRLVVADTGGTANIWVKEP